MAQLKNKIALITGAARGIGAGIAQHFQAAGAIVWLSDISDAEGIARAAALGPDARYVSLDVTDEDQWVRTMQQILARDGRLDILVNNAGYGIAGTVVDTSEDDWNALMAVNVNGVYLGCKYAIPVM
jgi:NAD(P)-dependent dehydrogenase (short-subunit alcohol dehydrogenase family)